MRAYKKRTSASTKYRAVGQKIGNNMCWGVGVWGFECGVSARSGTPAVMNCCESCGLGSGVWGVGCRVCGLGFRVWGLGFGVWGLGLGVWGSPRHHGADLV